MGTAAAVADSRAHDGGKNWNRARTVFLRSTKPTTHGSSDLPRRTIRKIVVAVMIEFGGHGTRSAPIGPRRSSSTTSKVRDPSSRSLPKETDATAPSFQITRLLGLAASRSRSSASRWCIRRANPMVHSPGTDILTRVTSALAPAAALAGDGDGGGLSREPRVLCACWTSSRPPAYADHVRWCCFSSCSSARDSARGASTKSWLMIGGFRLGAAIGNSRRSLLCSCSRRFFAARRDAPKIALRSMAAGTRGRRAVDPDHAASRTSERGWCSLEYFFAMLFWSGCSWQPARSPRRVPGIQSRARVSARRSLFGARGSSCLIGFVVWYKPFVVEGVAGDCHETSRWGGVRADRPGKSLNPLSAAATASCFLDPDRIRLKIGDIT